MFALAFGTSIRIHRLFRWEPSNILLALIRTRRGLKWGIPAMLLAAPLLLAAACCYEAARHGGPGWLNLLVAIFVWDAMRFLWTGPVSLVLLARVRIREGRATA